VVLPPVVVVLAFQRAFARIAGIGALTAAFLVLCLTPWCVLLHERGGADYLRVVFVDNTLGRFFTVRDVGGLALSPLNDAYFVEKGSSPLLYLRGVFQLPLPWLPFLVGALAAGCARRARSELELFALVGFVAIPLTLSLSSSRVMGYLLPALFPELLLCA